MLPREIVTRGHVPILQPREMMLHMLADSEKKRADSGEQACQTMICSKFHIFGSPSWHLSRCGDEPVGFYVLTPGCMRKSHCIEMPCGDWMMHTSCKLQGMKCNNYPRMVLILFMKCSNYQEWFWFCSWSAITIQKWFRFCSWSAFDFVHEEQELSKNGFDFVHEVPSILFMKSKNYPRMVLILFMKCNKYPRMFLILFMKRNKYPKMFLILFMKCNNYPYNWFRFCSWSAFDFVHEVQ